MKNSQKLIRNTRRGSTTRGGFTLIEIMVVLAIATFVAAIVIGGFSEMTAGSKRTSCQTNLTQIYQAARLYAADEGGSFPYYDPTATVGSGNRGIGLWALYTFSQQSDPPVVAGADTIAPVGSKPIERYLRSAKSLHCPNDYDTDVDKVENLYTDATKTVYNADYLSYQVDRGFADDTLFRSTYSPVRNFDRSRPFPDWDRQLLFFNEPLHVLGASYDRTKQVRRLPTDNTVVTWCRWHRSGSGRNDIDPVLFYDGTVQLIPKYQDDPNGGPSLIGSQRLPKAAP